MNPITVVKCGGNGDIDVKAICDDVRLLIDSGQQVVVVHGGSAEIERLANQLGVVQNKQTAPDGVTARHTDARTLQVVIVALAGVVKPKLVHSLVNRGVRALGMTGIDVGLLRARRKRPQRSVENGITVIVRDNHAGNIEKVDTKLLHDLLDLNIVPVISPPAITESGEVLNVDADRAAAAIAGALDAHLLILLTGAAGVQSDPSDESSVLDVCLVPFEGRPAEWAKGGMALKLIAAREALRGGVGRVLIADGRRPGPVRRAMAGKATRVKLGPPTKIQRGGPGRRPEKAGLIPRWAGG